jgi:hypothetical protein
MLNHQSILQTYKLNDVIVFQCIRFKKIHFLSPSHCLVFTVNAKKISWKLAYLQKIVHVTFSLIDLTCCCICKILHRKSHLKICYGPLNV